MEPKEGLAPPLRFLMTIYKIVPVATEAFRLKLKIELGLV